MTFCDDCRRCIFTDTEDDPDYEYTCAITGEALEEKNMRDNDKRQSCKNFKLRSYLKN